MSKKITILYSGGLDSFIMTKLAKAEGYDYNLVHYDIGQEYSKKELDAIKNSGEEVEIRKVDWLDANQKLVGKEGSFSGNIIIPGRNMVLASLAASAFLPDEVWMGGLKGEDHDQSTDKNQKFIDKTNNLWSYVYSPFERTPKLVFPFIKRNWGKFEAVKWVYENGYATAEELLNTSSCLSGEEGKCGHCVVCCRRKYIFKQLGFEEKYNKDPLTGEKNLEMIIDMLKDGVDGHVSHYDEWRRREIIPGLHLEFGTNSNEELLKIIEDKLKKLREGK